MLSSVHLAFPSPPFFIKRTSCPAHMTPNGMDSLTLSLAHAYFFSTSRFIKAISFKTEHDSKQTEGKSTLHLCFGSGPHLLTKGIKVKLSTSKSRILSELWVIFCPESRDDVENALPGAVQSRPGSGEALLKPCCHRGTRGGPPRRPCWTPVLPLPNIAP